MRSNPAGGLIRTIDDDYLAMTDRIVYFFVTCVLMLSAATPSTAAFSIEGKVVNGTTGETDVNIDVTIVNPTGGMTEAGKAAAVGGEFRVDGLDENVPAYIVRLDYKGVRYDYMVRLTGDDPVKQTVYVYENTASWDRVGVRVPLFVVNRHGDHLQLERVIELTNNTDPPVTVTGDDGYFKFVLPEKDYNFQALFVYSLGVPIEQTPVPAGQPGVFRAEYPIRPGVTRVGLSFTVPYQDGHYVLSEEILYDTDKIVIASDDPGISITSETNTLVEVEDPHRPVSFVVENLKAGDELHLHLSGGGQSTARAGQPSVIVVPNQTEPLSFEVIAVLLAALLLLFVLAARESINVEGQKRFYEQARDALLNRMARLDDLYKTGAVTAAAYYTRRAEMKNQAAAVLFRLGNEKTPARRGGKSKAKGRRK